MSAEKETVSKEIVLHRIIQDLFSCIVATKMLHWQTHCHPTHLATDALSKSLFDQMDMLVETMISRIGSSALGDTKTNVVQMAESPESFSTALRRLKVSLQLLNSTPFGEYSQILNLRDGILSTIDQFTYLDQRFKCN